MHAAGGWAEVEKLYRRYPPVSTEQILHPEKWHAREAPVRIVWPSFTESPLFAGWTVLDENVLGEFSWKILFNQNDLAGEAEQAASGWNGDRYAVLERADETLVLIRSIWDTEEDARFFAAAYRRLLEHKRESRPLQALVSERGRDVTIVEGSDALALEPFLRFAESASLSEPGAVREF